MQKWNKNVLKKHTQVLAVGQFPPPVNGFSYITDSMVRLLEKSFIIETLDISARNKLKGIKKHVSRTARTLFACQRIALTGNYRRPICYIACEGRLGLIYTIAVIIAARISHCRIYLHHHNYTYIDRRYYLMKVANWLLGKGTHVFLCHEMEKSFSEQYRVRTQSKIVSNAAFVESRTDIFDRSNERQLVLGHLSNLTREKGLYIFLELFRLAVNSGLNVRAVLAGPVALAEDRLAIDAICAEFNDLFEYRGPLYDAEKDAFYLEVDLFVFPTEYANEAQPTVVFEALAAGCKVATYDRGCIANQVCFDGVVLSRSADFSTEALLWIKSHGWTSKTDRKSTAARFNEKHLTSLNDANRIFEAKPREVGV